MKRQLLFLSFLTTIIGSAFGQSLHQDIQATYDFEPHKLSDEKQKQKSKSLDNFWKKVTDNKEKYLPELRKELQDTSNSTFFSYDGGHLLLSLSKSNEDCQLALTAMLRGNLKDIDGTDYVRSMNYFSQKGLNTTEAGLKIIFADKFWAYIPQHSLMLDKYNSLLFILLPISTDLYLTKVIVALKQSKDTTTINNILHFLDYSCACAADSVILKYSSDNTQLDTVRKVASNIVKNNSHISRSDRPKKYMVFTAKRREILRRISDEALYELDEVTNRLKGYYNCR
jgi:hypothetical protein